MKTCTNLLYFSVVWRGSQHLAGSKSENNNAVVRQDLRVERKGKRKKERKTETCLKLASLFSNLVSSETQAKGTGNLLRPERCKTMAIQA